MTNTTSQYWDASGFSLNTFANNLTSWGDGREGARAFRGENALVPYRAGKRFVKKVPESYVMTLSGWVLGITDGSPKPTEEGFRANWRKLRRLLWNRGKQFPLTKRWIDADDGVTMRTATAMVEFVGGMEPKMFGPQGAFFSVDLELADPFFYSAEESITFAAGSEHDIEVVGDYDTTKIRFEMEGPLEAAEVRVASADPQVWIRYAVLDDNDTVIIDVDDWRSIETDGGIETLTIGKVYHDGAPGLFILEPGEHTVEFNVGAGTGTVVMYWQPAWL
jgi:hypothetical protein